jgi:nucleotide-binding universal stress UspA family protein
MFQSIVVGTDGSVTARDAVRHAAELAATHRADLHVVSAYRPLSREALLAGVPNEAGILAAAEAVAIDEHSRDECEAMLRDEADMHTKLGIKVHCHAVGTDPASAILDVAEEANADLIVVGSKGMTGTKRFLLGSVPNRVAHHARCSVLIVKTC